MVLPEANELFAHPHHLATKMSTTYAFTKRFSNSL